MALTTHLCEKACHVPCTTASFRIAVSGIFHERRHFMALWEVLTLGLVMNC